MGGAPPTCGRHIGPHAAHSGRAPNRAAGGRPSWAAHRPWQAAADQSRRNICHNRRRRAGVLGRRALG
jgi:hypothetical protein